MQTAPIAADVQSAPTPRRPLLCTLSDDERLRVDAAAAALTEYTGTPVAVKTLANHRWRGTGPLFATFGRIITYRVGDLRAWADERLGTPVRSTAERERRVGEAV